MNDTPSTWAMTARVTISRRPQDAADDVRMECSWDSPSTTSSQMSASYPSYPSSTPTTARPCYGFQRGDITFSTRPAQPVAHSPGSYASLPGRRAAPQPYSRRCKSTCSITLAEVRDDDDEPAAQVTRSNSLNAQDVTCAACGARRSPTAQRRSGANYTTHFCTRLPEKGTGGAGRCRDASSQTLDAEVANMAVDATIVVPKIAFDGVPSASRTEVPRDVVVKPADTPVFTQESKRPAGQVTSPKEELVDTLPPKDSLESDDVPKIKTTPSLLKVPLADEDGLNQPKCPPRLSRSPARLAGRSPLLRRTDCARTPRTDSGTAQRKPRTVHIDVYCTASEASDSSTSSSSSSSSEASWSSPRTVFESADTRIVHTRADRAQLPLALLRRSLRAAAHERNAPPPRGYDSEDGLSSECTSRDPSSSTLSSTMSGVDAYDSTAATSWKDTETQSRASLLSGPSIAGSDSFEYADSSDRLRIRERERAWAAQEALDGKSWRSPGAERRLVLQQQRFKEFLEKRLSAAAFPLRKAPARDESDEDDDGDSDETGDAWTFASPRSACALKREDTVRRATPTQGVAVAESVPAVTPVLMTPFTERAGLRTERLSCAERFGEIVGASRRPGHHVGPAKNPECTCAHCRAYCAEIGYRARTRSLDAATETANNWKAQLAAQLAQRGARKAGGGDSWDSNEV